MSSKGLPVAAVGIATVGIVFAYSGVKNKGLSATLKSFVANEPLTSSGGGTGLGGSNFLNALGGGAGGTGGFDSFIGSGTGSVAPGQTASVPVVAQYLTQSCGFSKAGAAGALGNIQIESSFNTRALNQGEGAIGLCQWEGGRRTALQAFARAHGGQETDLAIQLGYMRAELLTGYMDVNLYMRAANNPGSAAAYWDQHYEGSSGSSRQDRIAAAQSFYGQI